MGSSEEDSREGLKSDVSHQIKLQDLHSPKFDDLILSCLVTDQIQASKLHLKVERGNMYIPCYP